MDSKIDPEGEKLPHISTQKNTQEYAQAADYPKHRSSLALTETVNPPQARQLSNYNTKTVQDITSHSQAPSAHVPTQIAAEARSRRHVDSFPKQFLQNEYPASKNVSSAGDRVTAIHHSTGGPGISVVLQSFQPDQRRQTQRLLTRGEHTPSRGRIELY